MSDPYLKFIFSAADCKKGRKFLFSKDPDEQYGVGFDFELVLPEGVYLSSASATAVDRRTGAAAPGVLGSVTVEPNADGNNTVVCVPILDTALVGHSYCVEVLTEFDDALPTRDKRCFEFNVKPCK